MWLSEKLKHIRQNTTVEPAFFLFMMAIGMFALSSQELYIQKACRVNFNFTQDVCENLTHLADNHTQKNIQKYVAEIQAYNGILQSIPPIVFTLYGGPLSDKYGRKPLILVAFFGYLIQNIVFLVNSIWFHELKVEYLLFECLQDMTGGSIVLGMGLYALMVDNTTDKNRTKRMAVLDAFSVLGMTLGFVMGVVIKKKFGWISLYVVSLLVILCDIIYVIFKVEEVIVKVKPTEDNTIQHSMSKTQRTFKTVLNLTLSGFKCIFKKRPEGKRMWVLFFTLTMTIQRFAEMGWSAVGLLFFKLQYKGELADFSYLMSFFSLLTIISQLAIVPYISGRLKWRDTTLLIIATATSTVGYLIYALGHNLWVVIISYIFFAFYANINSTSRSLLSKMVDPSEIGATLAIIGILQNLSQLAGKPIYAFIYKFTLDVYPAAFLLVSTVLFALLLVLVAFAHFRMKLPESGNENNVLCNQETESRILKNSSLKGEDPSLSASLLKLSMTDHIK